MTGFWKHPERQRSTEAFGCWISARHRIFSEISHDYSGQGVRGGLIHMRESALSSPVIIKNDITVNVGLRLRGRNRALISIPGTSRRYLSSPSETSYEYYLQKTMLRDIRGFYGRFTEYAGKTNLLLNTFIKSREKEHMRTGDASNTDVMLKWFSGYETQRIIYSDMPRPRILYEIPERQTYPQSEHTENHIKETIEVEPGPESGFVQINHLSMKNVAEQVYRRLSDDLRRERLKKGY